MSDPAAAGPSGPLLAVRQSATVLMDVVLVASAVGLQTSVGLADLIDRHES